MANSEPSKKSSAPRGVRRIPEKSFLYDRVVPLALIGMAVLMALIVLAAVVILVGGMRF